MSFSSVEKSHVTAIDIEVNGDTLTVDLSDGRTLGVPLAWFPRLCHATIKERGTWRLIADGRGIHWPSIDEDISVTGLLAGQASMESQTSFEKWLAGRTETSPTAGKSGKRRRS